MIAASEIGRCKEAQRANKREKQRRNSDRQKKEMMQKRTGPGKGTGSECTMALIPTRRFLKSQPSSVYFPDPRLDVAANSDDDSVFNDDVSVVSEASTNSHLRDEGKSTAHGAHFTHDFKRHLIP